MTAATNQKTLRIPEFDGLRAIAVLFVFLYHFNEDIFFFGWCGVDIFFAISGFVITLQCYALQQKYSPGMAIKEFFIRRVSRIFPLYYLLLVSLLLAPVVLGLFSAGNDLLASLPKDISEPSIWKNALFLTNFYIFMDGYNSVSYGITWSLAVEEHFYLIFPFIFFFTSDKPLHKSLIILIVGVIILRAALALTSEMPGRLYFFTFSRVDAILLGCLAANFYLHHNISKKIIVYTTIGIFLSLFLALSFKHNEIPQVIFGYSIIPATIALLMLTISTQRPEGLRKLLSNKVMVYIGSVSYGFYLIHIWIVNGFESMGLIEKANSALGPIAGSTSMFLIELGLTLILSTASFYWFEKPARDVTTKLMRRN